MFLIEIVVFEFNFVNNVEDVATKSLMLLQKLWAH